MSPMLLPVVGFRGGDIKSPGRQPDVVPLFRRDIRGQGRARPVGPCWDVDPVVASPSLCRPSIGPSGRS
jgi:hypothetical protein